MLTLRRVTNAVRRHRYPLLLLLGLAAAVAVLAMVLRRRREGYGSKSLDGTRKKKIFNFCRDNRGTASADNLQLMWTRLADKYKAYSSGEVRQACDAGLADAQAQNAKRQEKGGPKAEKCASGTVCPHASLKLAKPCLHKDKAKWNFCCEYDGRNCKTTELLRSRDKDIANPDFVAEDVKNLKVWQESTASGMCSYTTRVRSKSDPRGYKCPSMYPIDTNVTWSTNNAAGRFEKYQCTNSQKCASAALRGTTSRQAAAAASATAAPVVVAANDPGPEPAGVDPSLLLIPGAIISG